MKNNSEHNGLPSTSFTAREIAQQPRLWGETYLALADQQPAIAAFLQGVFALPGLQVILTGAGTSAYIGQILQQPFFRNTGLSTRTVATTDLVTHPADYFRPSGPATLLVSFARSGESPESLAAFELAEKLAGEALFHFIITCNPDGALARTAAGKTNCFVFLLPEACNDRALAMTSSFTSMTLAGLLIADIARLEQKRQSVERLISLGQAILDKYADQLRGLAALDFRRVVFLGSGALKGTAREAHLKVTELTDGQIICQHESFLGFRHGPRAVIDRTTLLVYLFSHDPYVFKYEADLVRSIHQSEQFFFSLGIGQCLKEADNLGLDLTLELCSGESPKLPDDFFAICSVLPAQLLGLYKSELLGLSPDNPSRKGGNNRIVQGVHIYPF